MGCTGRKYCSRHADHDVRGSHLRSLFGNGQEIDRKDRDLHSDQHQLYHRIHNTSRDHCGYRMPCFQRRCGQSRCSNILRHCSYRHWLSSVLPRDKEFRCNDRLHNILHQASDRAGFCSPDPVRDGLLEYYNRNHHSDRSIGDHDLRYSDPPYRFHTCRKAVCGRVLFRFFRPGPCGPSRTSRKSDPRMRNRSRRCHWRKGCRRWE